MLQLDIVWYTWFEVGCPLLIGGGVEVELEGIERPKTGTTDPTAIAQVEYVILIVVIGEISRGKELPIGILVGPILLLGIAWGVRIFQSQTTLETPFFAQSLRHIGIERTDTFGVIKIIAFAFVQGTCIVYNIE